MNFAGTVVRTLCAFGLFFFSAAGEPAAAAGNSDSVTYPYTGQVVTQTISTAGYYSIRTSGAAGGDDSYNGFFGGKGASASGTFFLPAGTTLSIAVGGVGAGYLSGGGGGGSFVYIDNTSSLTALAVAGGGGGAGNGRNAGDGQAGSGGANGLGGGSGVGGSGGGGGNGGQAYDYNGGGGAGFNGNGGNGPGAYSGGGGQAPTTFAGGSASTPGSAGGYGGGGGSAGNGGGGGGGYSGGGGGAGGGGHGAGGGGSFVAASFAGVPTQSSSTASGTNTGNGSVTIALVKAASLVVTTTADTVAPCASGAQATDPCYQTSLRDALDLANRFTDGQTHTIAFDPTLSGQSIVLSMDGDDTFGPSALRVNKNVTIDGGTSKITITRDTTPNTPQATRLRLFYVSKTGNLTLKNLTLTKGLAKGGDGNYYGGSGGAAGLGGAIVNAGVLQLVQSTLTTNQAIGGSSGNGSGRGGGGLGADSPSGNSGGGPNGGLIAYNAGANAGFGGGGAFEAGFGGFGGGGGYLSLKGAGFGGGAGGLSYNGFGGGAGGGGSNPQIGGGAGGGGFGGAVFNYGGAVLMIDATLAGNSATGGIGGPGTGGGSGGGSGGGYGGAIFNLNGTVTATNATIARNVAAQGGGAIYSLGLNGIATQNGPALIDTSVSTPASVTLNNTILSGSTDGGTTVVSDYLQNNNGNGGTAGYVSSTGNNNIIQTPNSTGLNDFVGGANHADPKLNALADNGGVTQTMALQPGSSALDGGGNNLAVDANGYALATDQRGPGYPRVQGAVDIGAYEVQSPVVTFGTPPTGLTDSQNGAAINLTTFLNPGTAGTFTGDGVTGNIFNPAGLGLGAHGVTFTATTPDAYGHFATASFSILVTEAQSLIVTTDSDPSDNLDGRTSLREALAYAQQLGGTQTITFSNSAANGATNFYDGSAHTITLSGTELPIASNVTIQGAGANLLTISGNHASRVFRLSGGTAFVTATLDSLTIANGSSGAGGGILTEGSGATLNITNSRLTGNNGGGIWNSQGTVTITNSTLSGNSAALCGGIHNEGGTLHITNSALTGNSADSGSGIYNSYNGNAIVTNSALTGNLGGGILNYGTLSITNSTLSANVANIFGGGIYNQGTLTITNSTVSGNAAGASGGGILNISSGTLNITNSTVSGNTAGGPGGNGGGIVNSATMISRNTIIARNTAGLNPDVAGAATSQGYNIIGKADGSSGFSNGVNGDHVGTPDAPLDPLLGPLQNNGGPTQTMVPLPGSPAIGAGNPAYPVDDNGQAITTDQRGLDRQIKGKVDIGAVEAAVTNSLTIPAFTLYYGQTLLISANVVNATGGYVDFYLNGATTFSATGAVDPVSTVASGNFTNLTPGTYTLTASYRNGANSPEGNIAGSAIFITVLKASLTVTVTGYSVPFDGSAHTASAKVTALNGDDLSSLVDVSGTTHIGAGSSSDTWTFAGNTLYAASTGSVTDVINKVDAKIVTTGYAVDYDGTAHTAPITVTGVNNTPLTGLDLSGTTHTNAGTYPGDKWTFTDTTGNYNNASGAVNDLIRKVNAVANVTGYSVTYDGNSHLATGTVKGAGGATLTGLDLSGTSHTNAGAFTDNWTFTDTTGNYNNAGSTVNDVIGKASATIKVTPYNVTYDGNSHNATGTATGLGGVQLAGLNLTSTAHTNAGNYTDSWSFTDTTGNYSNAGSTVNDVIGKANAAIIVTPYNVLFDGNSHTATGTAKGVKGESLSGLTLTGTTHTNPGDYPADPWTFTDGTGNYNSTSGSVHDVISRPATNTTVTSSKNPSAFGDAVTFTAKVSPVAATGTVQFKIDTVNFGLPVTVASGSATSGSISTLALGNHAITAVYSGGLSYVGSTGSVTQVVAAPVHIEGGGTLSQLIHFGFNVQPVQDGTSAKGFKGHLEYQDKSVTVTGTSDGLKFKSSSVTTEYATDSRHGTFSGAGALNGVAGYSYTVTVEDNGSPGAATDKFRLQVFNPNGSAAYDSNARVTTGGLLAGGNVRIRYSAGTFSKGSLIGSGSVLSGTRNFDIDVRTDGTGGSNGGGGVQFTDPATSTFLLTSESITSMKLTGNVVTVIGPAMYGGASGYRMQVDYDTSKRTLQARVYDAVTNKLLYDSKAVSLTTGSITYTAAN